MQEELYKYKIIVNDNYTVEAEVVFNSQHTIYKGHFPNTPVTPGVCQVQLIREILSEALHEHVHLFQASEIKFLTMHVPTNTSNLHCKISYTIKDDGVIDAISLVSFERVNYMKIKASYKKTDIVEQTTEKKDEERSISGDAIIENIVNISNSQKTSTSVSFLEKNICVIIPTYNNSKTIADVICEVKKYCSNIIVVNDGCTDGTLAILNDIESIQLLSYSKNRGKGFALRLGMKYASEQDFEYAITIDSDGQHYAKDIPSFLSKLKEVPNALIIGSRKLNQENMPSKNSFANHFSNFWYKVETGESLVDTQSGYRLYPLKFLSGMHFFSNKYEFEIEVIVRACWEGIPVLNIPIDVYYGRKEERITHFRPFKDFFRISILNTILVILAFVWFLPRKIGKKYSQKSIKEIINNDIFNAAMPEHLTAASVGFGVFMGILPIWGYQLAVGFLVSHLLKLNKMLFFLAANISFPLFIPFILYFSFVTGGFVMGHGSWSVNVDLALIKQNFLQYIIGAVVLATFAGIVTGILSYLTLKLLKRNA